jgi:choline dehydrogenase
MPSSYERAKQLRPRALNRLAGITNGNIYAPTMMIAEKSADMVLGKTPLQPLRSQFYRRDAVAPVPPENT